MARLKELGDKLDASVAQVALTCLLARPFVSMVLLGVTNIRKLEENIGIADLLIRQLNSSFRPQRSGELESRKGLAITGSLPSQE